MDDLNPQAQSPEQKIIMEAVRRANEDIARRDAEEELQNSPLDHNEPEIPEDLEEVGKHSLSEMSTLARLGKATRSFELGGNDITIRSLTQGEELEILSRLNRFPPTSQSAVYATLCAAISLESVNGKPYFERIPLGPKDDIYLYKFKEFLKLYPIAINGIMAEYNELRTEVVQKAQYAKKG